MSSIMDFFRGTPAPTAAPVQQQPGTSTIPLNNQPNDSAAISGNVTIPNAAAKGSDGSIPAIPVQPKGDQSPLDKYADIFKVDPNAKAPESPVPTLNLDPVKLAAAVKQIDFTKEIPAELLQKARTGDGSAMVEVLQLSAQAGIAQSAALTGKMLETALTQLNKNYEEKVIPEVLRRNNVNQQLNSNPIFADPAMAPVMDGVKNAFIQKFPTASPADIESMAREYMLDFAGRVVKADGKQQVVDMPSASAVRARKEPDWNTLLGG